MYFTILYQSYGYCVYCDYELAINLEAMKKYKLKNGYCYLVGSPLDSEGMSLFQELFYTSHMVTVDLETTGLDPLQCKIASIGIGIKTKEEVWITFLFNQIENDFSQFLKPFLEDKKESIPNLVEKEMT